jgi:hypothetical protein
MNIGDIDWRCLCKNGSIKNMELVKEYESYV